MKCKRPDWSEANNDYCPCDDPSFEDELEEGYLPCEDCEWWQVGNSFTEKFENLITRCVWELPAREKELQRINQEIRQKRQQLAEMSSHYCKAARTLEELSRRIYELERIIYQQTEQWDM